MKKHIAYLGLLLTLALILSYVESLIPIFVSVPGVKLGLANLVVLICLYAYPSKYAFLISGMRVILAGLLFGSMFSILYSLAGAFFSLVMMLFTQKEILIQKQGFLCLFLILEKIINLEFLKWE